MHSEQSSSAQLQKELVHRIPWGGGVPAPFAVLLHDKAHEIIVQNSLKHIGELTQHLAHPELKMLLEFGPTNGGFPGPHIHYDGRVYPVNQVQWREYSHALLNVISDKLQQAKSVSPSVASAIANAAAAAIER